MNIFKHVLILTGALLLSFSLLTTSALAHKVNKVKGKRILIKTDGEAPIKGQYYYTINKSGKRKGLIKITKVKKGRAIGTIKKGKARKGWTLTLKKRKKKKKNQYDDNTEQSPMYWGGMFGFAINNMSVKFSDSNGTADMTGSGFSGKVLFDFALFESVWFRGLWGAETFNTTGTASGSTTPPCNSSTACKVNVTYLTADLWARYIFSKTTWRPWAGAGFIVLFPMSTDVNALDAKTITNTSNFAIGGGVDWYFSKDMFVPLQIEYDLYPSSSTVSASSIAIRIGFGMEL